MATINIDDAIHQIRKDNDKDNEEEMKMTTIGYAIPVRIDQPPQEIEPSSDKCCCKVVTFVTNGQKKHFVKMRAGGFVFDPWNASFESSTLRYAKHSGKNPYDFREVPEKVFRFYFRYLQTRNMAEKLNAEREIIG